MSKSVCCTCIHGILYVTSPRTDVSLKKQKNNGLFKHLDGGTHSAIQSRECVPLLHAWPSCGRCDSCYAPHSNCCVPHMMTVRPPVSVHHFGSKECGSAYMQRSRLSPPSGLPVPLSSTACYTFTRPVSPASSLRYAVGDRLFGVARDCQEILSQKSLLLLMLVDCAAYLLFSHRSVSAELCAMQVLLAGPRLQQLTIPSEWYQLKWASCQTSPMPSQIGALSQRVSFGSRISSLLLEDSCGTWPVAWHAPSLLRLVLTSADSVRLLRVSCKSVRTGKSIRASTALNLLAPPVS